MGVRGLYHYSIPFQKSIPIDVNYRIGIDALSLLYKYRGDVKKIFDFLKPILYHKILFVFDGKAPESKSVEIEKRKKSVKNIEEKMNSLNDLLKTDISKETTTMIEKEIYKLKKESWCITYEVRETFKKYLIENNYAFIKSIQEADAVLIDLYYANFIDVIVSNDMDFLIAGVDRLWIPMKEELKEVILEDILTSEEINKEQLKEVALLCGVDNVRISICYDVHYCMQLIRHYGSIESLMNHSKEMITLPTPNYIRDTKKRYYPNKMEPLKNVKEEHKIYLDRFKPSHIV